MKKKLYTTSDITRDLKISLRKIINWVGRGLVVPVVDASGAGSRRQYSYANLLEFGLVENLFDIGLGIHLIKRMLKDLRKDDNLDAWAEDWDSYWLETAKKHIQWLKEQQKKNKHFGTYLFNDGTNNPIKAKDINPDDPKDIKLIEERLKPPKPAGILAYGFKEDGSTEMKILPWDEENTLGTLFLHEYAYRNKGILIINLGRIKEKVDKRIEK